MFLLIVYFWKSLEKFKNSQLFIPVNHHILDIPIMLKWPSPRCPTEVLLQLSSKSSLLRAVSTNLKPENFLTVGTLTAHSLLEILPPPAWPIKHTAWCSQIGPPQTCGEAPPHFEHKSGGSNLAAPSCSAVVYVGNFSWENVFIDWKFLIFLMLVGYNNFH